MPSKPEAGVSEGVHTSRLRGGGPKRRRRYVNTSYTKAESDEEADNVKMDAPDNEAPGQTDHSSALFHPGKSVEVQPPLGCCLCT